MCVGVRARRVPVDALETSEDGACTMSETDQHGNKEKGGFVRLKHMLRA